MLKNKTTGILLLLIVVAGLAGVGYWWVHSARRIASDDALVSPESLASEGLYVDEQLCASCHADEAAAHAKSGHANTFRLAAQAPFADKLHGHVFADPERQYAFHYSIDDSGLTVAIPQKLGENPFPLTYALGSGQHGMTLLTLIPDRLGDTVGIEHRISFYRAGERWDMDLTPGQQGVVAVQDVEQFGVPIRGDKLIQCIRCHTTSGEIRNTELVGLRPNVGCQNCHGPGREHTLAMKAGGSVEGYSLSGQTATQQLELCGQCHRLPTTEASERAASDLHNIRFQPAGLTQSRCYQSSSELKCSTCHDPHEPVTRDAAHYERRCLECHGPQKSTRCPVSPQQACISCHMPAIDVHRGVKFHDHWIRVRRENEKATN